VNKAALHKLARESGGVQSRYGEHFGFHMSSVALNRFSDTIKAPLLKWIEDEGERNNTCTKNITGKVCSYCRCGKAKDGT